MMGKLTGELVLVTVFLILATLSSMQAFVQRREPRCPNTPADGWPEPSGCDFGVVSDICGKPSCAMGPGEYCKYKRFRGSNCGDGTFCQCSRCMGCSLINYTCFETTCVFPMSSN